MKNSVIPAVVSLLFVWQGAAQGALVWENTVADLHPALSDKQAVAHFKYKNAGDKPVKVISVHPSCGCTTAALAKDVVAPDESGEIVATFNIGGRTGVQTKTIAVMTDDQPSKPTVLQLKATIPQLLQISPTFIFWSPNDALDPKTITAIVGPDFPVTKLTVTSTDKAISTEVVSGPDKANPPAIAPQPGEKIFRIIVKPTEAGRPINAALKIDPDFPKDDPKTFYANVRVDSRAKKSAATPATSPAAK